MNGWLTALVAVVSAVLGGGGVAAFVSAFTGRRQRGAEVADRLSDTALKLVQELQEEAERARTDAREARRESNEGREEARQARLEASEARREVAEARREMAGVRREAEALAMDLRTLRNAVMSPRITLDQLRAMVGGESFNGRS